MQSLSEKCSKWKSKLPSNSENTDSVEGFTSNRTEVTAFKRKV